MFHVNLGRHSSPTPCTCALIVSLQIRYSLILDGPATLKCSKHSVVMLPSFCCYRNLKFNLFWLITLFGKWIFQVWIENKIELIQISSMHSGFVVQIYQYLKSVSIWLPLFVFGQLLFCIGALCVTWGIKYFASMFFVRFHLIWFLIWSKNSED